jgi:hypothetical protein
MTRFGLGTEKLASCFPSVLAIPQSILNSLLNFVLWISTSESR